MSRAVVPLRQAAVEPALKSIAFDRLPVPVACVSASGQLQAVNAAFAEFSGQTPDQLVNRSLFELAGPIRRDGLARRWSSFFQRLLRNSAVGGVLCWTHADGRRLRLRVQGQLISIAGDQVALLIAHDASAEHAARQERRLREARIAALSAADSPGFLLGADRRVIAHNSAADAFKQDASLQLDGLPFDYLLDEASADEFRLDFEAVRTSDRASLTRLLRLRSQVAGDGRRLNCTLSSRLGRRDLAAILVVLQEVDSVPSPRVPELARQARRLELRERLLELAVASRQDFQAALSRLLRVAAETLDVTAAGFWLHEGEPRALRCESMYLRRQKRFGLDWAGAEFPLPLFPAQQARLREHRPLAIEDLASNAESAALAREPRWVPVRALLGAPILMGGELRGLLSLHAETPRQWDEDEVEFATTAALLIALAMEAAQRQQAESRVEQLAWYDSLTGLPNRNLLREMLRDTVAGAAKGRRRIALLLIDLDRFKDVNDTLGHLVGDALIKSAAHVLRDLVGGHGIVGRLGGDEFMVVLNEFQHRQEVSQFAARLAQALHRTDLVPNIDTQVSASIGVALFPEHGREMSTLMKNADAAMYQAKRDGRNQFSFFNPIRYESAAREVQLGIQLLKALHGGAPEFFVEYQPQVQLSTGRVVGLEALIRWQHPTYGRLTPDRFIGVAEASGLSERISRWLMGEVCAQILRWRARQPGFDIPIAINVAGRELGSALLPSIVRSSLQQHRVEPSMITLEITERTLVKQNETNNDVLAELASIGVGLVLDDFGTGYSMLGYLKRMPIRSLKIDGSFIEGVPGDADSCAIVHVVLAVARHFRLNVIAEGVETAAQMEYLRAVGCEYAQGFYFSRPLRPREIIDHIELEPRPS